MRMFVHRTRNVILSYVKTTWAGETKPFHLVSETDSVFARYYVVLGIIEGSAYTCLKSHIPGGCDLVRNLTYKIPKVTRK